MINFLNNNVIYVDNTIGYYIKISNIYENPKIKYKLVDNYNNCCNKNRTIIIIIVYNY